jgi:predicted RNase H-like nuclease
MTTVGIDLAAQAENTAACSILWRADVADVQQISCNLSVPDLLELVKTGRKVGIDVPLGWPSAFVQSCQ